MTRVVKKRDQGVVTSKTLDWVQIPSYAGWYFWSTNLSSRVSIPASRTQIPSLSELGFRPSRLIPPLFQNNHIDSRNLTDYCKPPILPRALSCSYVYCSENRTSREVCLLKELTYAPGPFRAFCHHLCRGSPSTKTAWNHRCCEVALV